MTPEIKQMIAEEAAELYAGRNGGMLLSDGYTAGRMKGVKEAIEFVHWVVKDYVNLPATDRWVQRNDIGWSDAITYTTTELLTIFYKTLNKVK